MKTQVCNFSGFLPGAGCDETQTIDAPRQSIAIAECPYHRKLYVAEGRQEAFPRACAPKGAVEKSVLILPSQTRAFTHLMLPQVYTLSADCQTRQRSRLRVVSPSQKTLILIPGMDTKEQEIALQAEAEEGAELSWFINGKFLGSKTANEPLWWQPSLGEHTIVVSDPTGRSTRKTVTVRAH
jgi:membrane carboxypeptidase/penicillin-binding protein PbpC